MKQACVADAIDHQHENAPSDGGGIDAQRRFGGLSRLYGPEALGRLRAARVAVAGLGGVGSWTVEALARCGVGALTLIDLDHIAESNVNRQVHALTSTLGQAKVEAMAGRVRGINPDCAVTRVDDFVEPCNVDRVLAGRHDVIIDCTDQSSAKIAMILHARARGMPLVLCGGAGGKTDPLALRAGDLAQAVNDALLSKLRAALRREHGFARGTARHGKRGKARAPKMGVRALWFDQPAILPEAWGGAGAALACAGYGSVVTVTAVMGMAAASEAIGLIVAN